MSTTSPRLTQRVCPLKVGKQYRGLPVRTVVEVHDREFTLSPLRSRARVEGVERGEQGASDLTSRRSRA